MLHILDYAMNMSNPLYHPHAVYQSPLKLTSMILRATMKKGQVIRILSNPYLRSTYVRTYKVTPQKLQTR